MRLQRLFHTVRHLRPIQIYGRLVFRLYRPRPDYRPAPEPHRPTAAFAPPVRRPISLLKPTRFRFLNREGELFGAEDWNSPAHEKLWLYNLHYFDDLNAEDAQDRSRWHQALIRRWIAENPPGHGNGWEPYPTSLRIVNWIKWLLADNPPVEGMLDSLATQTRWLRKRLEHHILGNHLLANAKALVFAGVFFAGSEPEAWLHRGLSLLQRELGEQVLPDGGHFERSPMYHLIVLEDVLDLINLHRTFGQPIPEIWLNTARRMLHWAAIMQHPDGDIPFFNDAAFGIAPIPEAVRDYAQRLGVRTSGEAGDTGLRWLPDSGYARLSNSRCTAFFDAAPIGPDYLPGHAHADTLSVEASVDNQRVLVNSGTSVYGTSSERLRQRGTAAHNTVVIDEADSSEIWSGFRVARRAYPRDVTADPAARSVSAWHDGYVRLPGKPQHHRTVTLDDDALRIRDRISGQMTHAVTGRFHLHPEVRISQITHTAHATHLALQILGREDGVGTLKLEIEGPMAVSVAESTFHPQFGVRLANQCVTLAYQRALPLEITTTLRW